MTKTRHRAASPLAVQLEGFVQVERGAETEGENHVRSAEAEIWSHNSMSYRKDGAYAWS